MAMSPFLKMQKESARNHESAKLKKQKRRDYRDEVNAGVYNNGKDHYLDEDDNYRDDLAIPTWFKNLSRAWQSNKELGARRRRKKTDYAAKPLADDWNNWCDDRVEMLGEDCDPRTQKAKVGRPRLPDHQKKNPTKVKRSEQMKALLLDHDIVVESDGSLKSKDGHYVGWKFQINGRVKFEDEDPISVHKFLTLI